jgi:hypothetical protein
MPLAQVSPRPQLIFLPKPGVLEFILNFQLQFNLFFSEEVIRYSRTSTSQVQMP